MSIIAHICDDVKSYIDKGEQAIREMIAQGRFRCGTCFKPLQIHSSYRRGVKEKGVDLEIKILRCDSRCGKGHALLPDFISPNKHYGMHEIEKVVAEAQAKRVSEIDTRASESTARRWVAHVAARMAEAASAIKAAFVALGSPVSELLLDRRGGFSELESLLDAAPRLVPHSGTTLGLANLWLGSRSPPVFI